MKPRRTPHSNVLLTLAGGNEDNFLYAEHTKDELGAECFRTVWEISAAEREHIAAGGNVYLIAWGTGQQPVAIGVTDIPFGAPRREVEAA